MFYIVGVAIVLIIIGIFTLDIIKISIGAITVLVTFLVYKSKLDKATKDPILFEMLKSVTDINEEIQKKIRGGKNYSSHDEKYMGIILLVYVGFIKAASARSPINKGKFKDLFYAAFNAINFSLKKEMIDTLYDLQQDGKHEIADKIILLGVIAYSKKINGQDYLDNCMKALEELYDDQKTPKSIERYYSETEQKSENRKNVTNKAAIIFDDDFRANIRRRPEYVDPENAEVIYNLGVSFANGINVERDDQEALKLWKIAADKGHSLAHFNLGNWYFHGKAVEQNYEKAVEHYKEASKSGMLQAINNLANCYYQGLGVPINTTEAARLYLVAAEKGFTESQYHLGNCYYFGHGVEQSIPEMLKWHQKAAEKNHAEAQCNMGLYYADGVGLKKNLSIAKFWFMKAAKQGEERAINGLEMIKKEIEIQNIEEFEKLLEPAKNGNAEAQCKLARYYLMGKGVKINDKEAFKWYKKAAEQGFSEAQYCIGRCYDLGRGIEIDQKEAFKWFKKAAEQGHYFAQYYLGVDYYEGKSVPKDILEARKWLRKAADQDFSKAKTLLNKIEKE